MESSFSSHFKLLVVVSLLQTIMSREHTTMSKELNSRSFLRDSRRRELDTVADTCSCDEETVTTLQMISPGRPDGELRYHADRFRSRVDAFYERTGVEVEIIEVGLYDDVAAETLADATAKVYDGYFFLPAITGEVVELDGFADLTNMIPDIEGLEWTDIFPFNRLHQAVYDNKVLSIPCDGDQYVMYYRKDLFNQYGVQPPRTWDEYTEVAEFFDGMEVPAIDGNGTQILSGSCIPKSPTCSWHYGINLMIHASTVQANGTKSGIFFDPKTSEPLLGKAFAETLRHAENLDKLGHPDEWTDDCWEAVNGVNTGTCVMNFFWGDFFSEMLSRDFDMSDKLGVSSTPGSTRVLDRETGELVPCTPEICPYAVDYPDIGLVNTASFAAAGGWSAAVSNNIAPQRQKLMADFMGFVCGKDESAKDVIADGRKYRTGADPFRKSHRDIETWLERGYPLNTTIQYMETVDTQLASPNLALDTRFPKGSALSQAVFDGVREHLLAVRATGTTSHDSRLATADKLTDEWATIVEDYDSNRPASALPFFDVYKKAYGAYVPPSPLDSKSLSKALIAGIVAGGVIILILGLWTLYLNHRNKKTAEEKRIAEERTMKLQQLKDGYDSDSDSSTASYTEISEERDELMEIKKLITGQAKVISICRGVRSFMFLGVCSLIVAYIALDERFQMKISSEEMAGVVSALLVVVSVISVVCSWLEDRRATILMEHGARTNAVVTNMFPGDLRAQVLGDDMVSDGLATIHESLDDAIAIQSHGFKTGQNGLQSKQIADLYLETTVIFADIVGFTAWSSAREPSQVLMLLESVFASFDECAMRRGICKVETVGDCYVAVTGVPKPRADHASRMGRFALDIRKRMNRLAKSLEVTLGPDTGELKLRIGMHSGPVTGGVLRGARARFQLFGDTVNTTERIESTGMPGRIHVSEECAQAIIKEGREGWLHKREDSVTAKGKGELTTYWLVGKSNVQSVASSTERSEDRMLVKANKGDRLVEWNLEVFLDLIRKIVAARGNAGYGSYSERVNLVSSSSTIPIDEVQEIIHLPDYQATQNTLDPQTIEVPSHVVKELRDYIATIAGMYQQNPFHNFEHASHVVLSVGKMLSRIIAPSDILTISRNFDDLKASLHDHTYGITSDPLTQFACAFSALVHDVDHRGIGNPDLINEDEGLRGAFGERSVAEQNSLELSWHLLMEDSFHNLRAYVFQNETELQRFRQLVVNSVMATDIMDKELKAMRNGRWEKAFKDSAQVEENSVDAVNRKATIVIEHLIQASDVSHTMQHWHVYLKWNKGLFKELYDAFKAGRSKSNPVDFWAKGEIGFFDFYIIPLAKKLKDCGVFGKSSDEYLHYAERNRAEWAKKGESIVAAYIKEIEKEDTDSNRTINSE